MQRLVGVHNNPFGNGVGYETIVFFLKPGLPFTPDKGSSGKEASSLAEFYDYDPASVSTTVYFGDKFDMTFPPGPPPSSQAQTTLDKFMRTSRLAQQPFAYHGRTYIIADLPLDDLFIVYSMSNDEKLRVNCLSKF